MADVNIAISLDPSYVEAHISRGAILYNLGKYDKAITEENQALAINPSSAEAYGNRAESWDMKGEYDKAKADFFQAIAIDPNCPSYYNDLAFFQATCLDAEVPRRRRGLRQREQCLSTDQWQQRGQQLLGAGLDLCRERRFRRSASVAEQGH